MRTGGDFGLVTVTDRILIAIRRAYHSQDPGDLISKQPLARELVNSNAFGSNMTLMKYGDRLHGEGTSATTYRYEPFGKTMVRQAGDLR